MIFISYIYICVYHNLSYNSISYNVGMGAAYKFGSQHGCWRVNLRYDNKDVPKILALVVALLFILIRPCPNHVQP